MWLRDLDIMRHDVYMRPRVLVFAFFAAAMLLSVVREWSAPASCPRVEMTRKRCRIAKLAAGRNISARY